MVMGMGEPVFAGGREEVGEGCSECGAEELGGVEGGDGDQALAVELDGQGKGEGKDAQVAGDGQAFDAESMEKMGVEGDGEYRDDGSGDGRGERIPGGIEGPGVDALR